MLWLRSHRWYRDQLSAYVDGELAGKDALRVDAHVESCDACAAELVELRAASALLAELADVAVPRSFAVTAEDVAPRRKAPATGFVRSANSGLRIAGAGLAVALAVVLVLDAGGLVGGGETETSSGRDNFLQPLSAIPDQEKAMRDSYIGQTNSAVMPTFAPTETSGAGTGSAGAPGPLSGGVGGPSDTAAPSLPLGIEPSPTPLGGVGQPGAAATQLPAVTPEPARDGTANGGPAASPQESPAAEPYGAVSESPPTASPSTQPQAAAQVMPNGAAEGDFKTLTDTNPTTDSDGGPSAVLVTEIVLAALLGASIAGITAATYAERRRR